MRFVGAAGAVWWHRRCVPSHRRRCLPAGLGGHRRVRLPFGLAPLGVSRGVFGVHYSERRVSRVPAGLLAPGGGPGEIPGAAPASCARPLRATLLHGLFPCGPGGWQVTSILVTTGIVVMVVLARQLAQPWRGIVALGVVAGLVWGLVRPRYLQLTWRSPRRRSANRPTFQRLVEIPERFQDRYLPDTANASSSIAIRLARSYVYVWPSVQLDQLFNHLTYRDLGLPLIRDDHVPPLVANRHLGPIGSCTGRQMAHARAWRAG